MSIFTLIMRREDCEEDVMYCGTFSTEAAARRHMASLREARLPESLPVDCSFQLHKSALDQPTQSGSGECLLLAEESEKYTTFLRSLERRKVREAEEVALQSDRLRDQRTLRLDNPLYCGSS
jgi:hypothetical protein